MAALLHACGVIFAPPNHMQASHCADLSRSEFVLVFPSAQWRGVLRRTSPRVAYATAPKPSPRDCDQPIFWNTLDFQLEAKAPPAGSSRSSLINGGGSVVVTPTPCPEPHQTLFGQSYHYQMRSGTAGRQVQPAEQPSAHTNCCRHLFVHLTVCSNYSALHFGFVVCSPWFFWPDSFGFLQGTKLGEY